MIFGEKSLIQDNTYTPFELLKFVQSLIRESTSKRARLHSLQSNYGWLRSRALELDVDLEEYKNTVSKLSSESCAAIAVQLGNLTEDHHSADAIMSMFENLINEQQNINLIENNIKNGKEKKKKSYPELLPPGRKSSVAFMINHI